MFEVNFELALKINCIGFGEIVERKVLIVQLSALLGS